ncbi:MAG: DUF4982 domain-containing protein [Lachnospiraceae bacterium]|nr:DUF4982 domain-containing protein [Lachnospiraceae bacterium]
MEVYSGSDELFINSESVGRVRTEKCKALFHTVFTPGILSAVSYTEGIETGRDELKPPLTASILRQNPKTA